jgi:prepilin-type N-terminal cleavage/methylation domain-containing protein
MSFKNNNKQKNAFSLIELSIVLIIIGLLIAGVTGGSSLIKSASLQSAVREVLNYRTALNIFYEKTGSLPLDSAASFSFANSCNAWEQLKTQGLVGATNATTCGSSPTLSSAFNMNAKIKNAWYALGYRSKGNADDNDVTTYNRNSIALFGGADVVSDPVTFLNTASGSDSSVKSSALNKNDSLFFDKKLDDGNLDAGSVIGVGTSNCKSTDELAGNELVCALFFDIGL